MCFWCCGLSLDVPDCLSRLITRPNPPSEIELDRWKNTLRADDARIEAGNEDDPAMDNQARTELEARIEKMEKELTEWKQKQTQSTEWQYANCWTSVCG